MRKLPWLLIVAESGELLENCGIKSAFTLLPIFPGDLELLSFAFGCFTYVSMVMPMRCSILCAVFKMLRTFLGWAFQQRLGKTSILYYINDFLFAGKLGSLECRVLMATFQELVRALGVQQVEEKREGSFISLSLLGTLINMEQEYCVLPRGKVCGLFRLLEHTFFS